MSGLEPFRRRLDAIDEQIARLLGERFEICREIALYKSAHAIPMMQPGRVAEVRARYLARGAEAKLPVDFTAALFELLIGATCKLEDELIAAQAGGPVAVGAALATAAPAAQPAAARQAPGAGAGR
jgi:4-amino-4-deoxychorismate mutase